MNQVIKSWFAPKYKVAVLQFLPELGQKLANLAALHKLIQQAASRGVKLVVCPEMCTVGYVFNNCQYVLNLAETARGDTFEFFARICRQYKLLLVYGYPEIEHQNGFFCLYNSQNLIGPDGDLLATYRKTHLFHLDHIWADVGNSGYRAVSTPLGFVGLGICMDMNFDCFINFQHQNSVDIVAISNCWVDDLSDPSLYWLNRWQGTNNLVAIANYYGQQRDVNFSGTSCFIKGGQLLAKCPPYGESILMKEIDFVYPKILRGF